MELTVVRNTALNLSGGLGSFFYIRKKFSFQKAEGRVKIGDVMKYISRNNGSSG